MASESFQTPKMCSDTNFVTNGSLRHILSWKNKMQMQSIQCETSNEKFHERFFAFEDKHKNFICGAESNHPKRLKKWMCGVKTKSLTQSFELNQKNGEKLWKTAKFRRLIGESLPNLKQFRIRKIRSKMISVCHRSILAHNLVPNQFSFRFYGYRELSDAQNGTRHQVRELKVKVWDSKRFISN